MIWFAIMMGILAVVAMVAANFDPATVVVSIFVLSIVVGYLRGRFRDSG